MFENWDLEFDKPIAERVIEGNDCTITVQLGPPRPETFVTTDDPGWYCPYRIKGIPGEPDHKMFGGGEDAIGAIIGALCNLGAELNYRWKDHLGLNWFDTEHLGFLDIDKLPWSKERTPEERQRNQAIIDVWSNPTSTPEEQQAIIDKFFQEQFSQEQRESGTD
jgi:hypothetical protein